MSQIKIKANRSKIKTIKTNYFFSRGFSLIEMIVVISILGVVMVIASSFLLISLMASSKAEITKEVRQNGNQALSVIEGMVLNSLDVGCTYPLSPDTYRGIRVEDINNKLSVVEFDIVNNKIASTSATQIYSLTSTNVSVTGGFFTCDKNPGQPTTVVVNFLVGIGSPSSRPSEKASLKFQTQIVTRNISNF